MRLGSLGSETVVPVSLEHLDSGRPFSVHKLLQKLISRGFSDFNRAERDFLLSFNYRDPFRLHGSTWLLAAQQWRFNLQYLQDTFRLRRYDALVHPGMRTYRPLIHLRQLIVDMRDQLPKAYSQSLHHTSYQEKQAKKKTPTDLDRALFECGPTSPDSICFCVFPIDVSVSSVSISIELPCVL